MAEPRTKAQRRVAEARAALELELGRLPTVSELADRLGVTRQAVSAQLRALGLPTLRATRRARGELVSQREAAARAERQAARAAKLADIVAMGKAGMPQHEIAAHAGECQSSVSSKLRRAGVKHFDRWTVERLTRMVEMLAEGIEVRKVAREFRRSLLAVVSAWRRLCASKPGAYARAYAALSADSLARAGATLERTKLGYWNGIRGRRVDAL